MARKFLTALDLAKNELQNGVIQNLASAPSSPVKGQLYMNSTDNTLYWWNGTSWVSAAGGGAGFPGYGAVPAETTFGLAKSDGAATTTARSDHTHGSPAHNAADHSTIPLSALAAATANINMGGFKVTNLGAPTAAGDATTKGYVDGLVNGLSWKAAVLAATTANITLSAPQTIDGVGVVAGDRVLVKNQTTTSANGIYDVQPAAWLRSIDFDNNGEVVGAAVYVTSGTTQADTAWAVTSPDTTAGFTLGTNPIAWGQVSGPGTITAGAGLTSTGNTLDVGAGTGITVAANAVAVNGSSVPYWSGISYAANVGGATSQVLTHNLNTRDCVVNLYRVATPYDTVECDVERTDVNNVTLRFAVAPAASEYRAVIFAKAN